MSTAASPGDDVHGQVQVAEDARKVAVSVLANERRRAISKQALHKVTATVLFMHTPSFTYGLVSQTAFLNRVKRMREDEDVKREARAVVTEEVAEASNESEDTADVSDDTAQIRQQERARNPQPFFIELVHQLYPWGYHAYGSIRYQQHVHGRLPDREASHRRREKKTFKRTSLLRLLRRERRVGRTSLTRLWSQYWSGLKRNVTTEKK